MRLEAAPIVPITEGTRAVLGRARVQAYAGTRDEVRLTLWKPKDATFESWAPYWRYVP